MVKKTMSLKANPATNADSNSTPVSFSNDRIIRYIRNSFLTVVILSMAACAGGSSKMYRDENMDFGSLQNIAVLPCERIEDQLPERVRDVPMTALPASEAFMSSPPVRSPGIAGGDSRSYRPFQC
jgi:hypothetical protein